MLGHSEGGAVVEFGADSVILVRSDDSRDRLREVVGDGEQYLSPVISSFSLFSSCIDTDYIRVEGSEIRECSAVS